MWTSSSRGLWNTRHEIRLWLRLLHFDFDFYTSTSSFTLPLWVSHFAVRLRLWRRLTLTGPTFHLEFRFERLSAATSWSVRDSLVNDLSWPLPPGGHSTKHVHKCRTNLPALIVNYYPVFLFNYKPTRQVSNRNEFFRPQILFYNQTNLPKERKYR